MKLSNWNFSVLGSFWLWKVKETNLHLRFKPLKFDYQIFVGDLIFCYLFFSTIHLSFSHELSFLTFFFLNIANMDASMEELWKKFHLFEVEKGAMTVNLRKWLSLNNKPNLVFYSSYKPTKISTRRLLNLLFTNSGGALMVWLLKKLGVIYFWLSLLRRRTCLKFKIEVLGLIEALQWWCKP